MRLLPLSYNNFVMNKPIAYSGTDNYIFISYSHKDEDVVLPFISELQKKFNVWFDEGLHFGTEWEDEIIKKIAECRVFIYMVSPRSIESENCENEILYARRKKKDFFNIMLEKFELPETFVFRYGKYQSCLLYQYSNINTAIDNIERKFAPVNDCRCKGYNGPALEQETPKVEEKWEVNVPKNENSRVLLPANAQNNEYALSCVAIINQKFRNVGLKVKCISYNIGPSHTRYNLEVGDDVSFKKCEEVAYRIGMYLGGKYARFVQTVPGRTTSAIEIQNEVFEPVPYDVFDGSLPSIEKVPLAIPLGIDACQEPYWIDLASAPHILIGGTTGSGKSVLLHSFIYSLISRNTPDMVRIALIDPKKVECAKYRDMPHLLHPIITEVSDAIKLLKRLVNETEKRYELFGNNNCVSIQDYNEHARKNGLKVLPYFVVIIDEYADVVDTDRSVSDYVTRLALKSRAAGIHLIVATQRPSANIVTGVMKANFPTKIALMTASFTDSIVILGEGGAEKLNGSGDMLVSSRSIQKGNLVRLQGCYIENARIYETVKAAKMVYQTKYDHVFLDDNQPVETPSNEVIVTEEEKYQSVKQWAMTQEYISISKLQREYGIGFNRAGKFFKRLQEDGIVSNGPSTSKGNLVIKKDENF